MQKKNLVYIIGFMGSGKSTAGEKLASSLGWSFIDLDRKIEEKAGKTIPQIFSQHGESYFRSIETDLLRSVGSGVETVVSTGGGTPCHGDNMNFMLQTGLTVYLKMTPSQLAGRLIKSTDERPLLKNIPDEKLISFIDEKLIYREKWYNRSNIVINGIDLDISLLSSKIKTSLSL